MIHVKEETHNDSVRKVYLSRLICFTPSRKVFIPVLQQDPGSHIPAWVQNCWRSECAPELGCWIITVYVWRMSCRASGSAVVPQYELLFCQPWLCLGVIWLSCPWVCSGALHHEPFHAKPINKKLTK